MAMQQLINEHGINVLPLPADVLEALKAATAEVIAQERADNEDFDRIYAAYDDFYQNVKRYHALSEQAYYENR
jgi:TRAP-type mannitol/chloroaromatic compound transport system substrate-binding protein